MINPHSRTKKAAILVAACTTAALTLSACGSDSKSGGNTGISAAEGTEPLANRPMPVDNSGSKKPRIAVVTFPGAAAEFFKAVEAGAERANAVLGEQNAKVDFVPVTQFTPDAVNAAVRTTITQGYDAIAVTVLGPANCAPIKEAVAKGIKVAAIIGSDDCAEDAGALFYHGEDGYPAWKENVAPAVIEATGDKKCKVGIITGSFSTTAHELRRTGLIDGLKGSNLTPASKGIEGGVDPAKFQAAARDYISAYPDLCAIVVTVGDNGAAASALNAEQAKKIKVINADVTTGSEKQIKAGKQYGSFTQDPFGESYDSAIWLYNAVIDGKGPEGGFNQPVKGKFVTKDNLADAVQAQDRGE